MSTAKLNLGGKDYELPVVVGTEHEVAIDITKLRAATGAITLDPGYGNTGSCESAITFIDGEKGILRYRGYRIEELAKESGFSEVCHLLVHGELPTVAHVEQWRHDLVRNGSISEGLYSLCRAFPKGSHPMAVLAAMITALDSENAPLGNGDVHEHDIIRLIGQALTIATAAYRIRMGKAVVPPKEGLGYAGNFLRMMYASDSGEYEVNPVVEHALNMLLILHADHEQNCSTSTVRMVGSSHASIYATMASGICALWGPLHGGANQAVIEMLEQIHADGGDYKKYVGMAKDKDSGFRLMGFGHRVYKNFDPRATLLREACGKVLHALGVDDPLLNIAMNLEKIALEDDYFVERKLYPNVDFYSGIIYRAMGIPVDMFTVMFALGRLPGWIAHWKEMREEGGRIHRPRQVYTGATVRDFVPIGKR